MRPSLVFSLLLLYLLLAKVQGIRLDRESQSLAAQQQTHDEQTTLMEKSNGGEAEEVILCKDEQCTGRIKSRKLVTTSISSFHELPKKKVKKERDEAHFSVNGNTTRRVKLDGGEERIKVQTLPTSGHLGLHHEQNPDLVDVAEMDYSPARRKPPIHN